MSTLEDLRRKQAVAEQRLLKDDQDLKNIIDRRVKHRGDLNDIIAKITIIELDERKKSSWVGDMIAHKGKRYSIGRKVAVNSLDDEKEVDVPIRIGDPMTLTETQEMFDELKREQENYERQLEQDKYAEDF